MTESGTNLPTPAQIREQVLAALRKVAPEADPSGIDPAADLRRELDVDSMDFLNFLIRIREAVGVDVPEADASRLRSIDEIVRYLSARAPSAAPAAAPRPASSSGDPDASPPAGPRGVT